jgi:hypothetical protein
LEIVLQARGGVLPELDYARKKITPMAILPTRHPLDAPSLPKPSHPIADINIVVLTTIRDGEVLYRREMEVRLSRTKLEGKLSQWPRPIRVSSSRRANATEFFKLLLRQLRPIGAESLAE